MQKQSGPLCGKGPRCTCANAIWIVGAGDQNDFFLESRIDHGIFEAVYACSLRQAIAGKMRDRTGHS
jgi:hypothetical protein